MNRELKVTKIMETKYLTYPHDLNKTNLSDSVAAIGFFDGIHKGHQAVINQALDYAKKHKKKCSIITFHPHPSVVLNSPNKTVKYITPQAEKERLLKEMGVDQIYVIKFNKELSLVKPEEFIEHFIVGLNITHLVAGFDFSFGHKGQGNMTNIEKFAKNRFTFEALNKVQMNESKISSTQIRKLLAEGLVKEAGDLLGRPFTYEGTVVTGDKRGRLIGFPTANLETNEEYLLPKKGVYAVKLIVSSKVYYGMANLGFVPTFKEDMSEPKIEVYIFDFNKDIYGETIKLEWLEFVREEQKFSGIEEIKAQLKTDEINIRKIINK